MPADIRLLIGAGVCVGYAWSRWVLHQRHASRVASATVPHAPIPDFEIARFAGKPLHQVAVQDRWWPRACVDTTVLAAVVGPHETRVFVTTHWFSWGPKFTIWATCKDLSDPSSPVWATLKADDDSWVVVTDGERRSRCSVLSVNGALSPEVMQGIRAQLAQRGFDVSPESLRAQTLSPTSSTDSPQLG